MRVTIANVSDLPDMPRKFVVQDGASVGAVSGIALFQEVSSADPGDDDQAAVMEGLGDAFEWVPGFEDLEIPIAFRSKFFEVGLSGFQLMHKGRAHVSPDRFCTWAFMRQRRRGLRRPGVPFVVVNTHFVSGAFSKPGQVGDPDGWRIANWNIHYVKMRELVLGFWAQGYTVFFGGDFNRMTVQPFAPEARWLVQYPSIDKLGVIEGAGQRVEVWTEDTIPLNSDHDARMVDVRMECLVRPRPSWRLDN